MHLSRVVAVVAVLAALPLAQAAAESGTEGDDRTGMYSRFGISLGLPSIDGISNPTTMVGVGGAVGYRIFSWLAAEGELVWTGGGEVEGDGNATISFLGFTAIVKGYPLAPFSDRISQRLQPYVSAGFGGGYSEIDGGMVPNGRDGLALARVGGGVDWYFSDSWAVVFDIAHEFALNDSDILDGVTLINMALQVDF